MSGKLIVFEGIDGVGKTTQINLIKEEYPDCVYVSNPGGTEYSDMVRKNLKAGKYKTGVEQFIELQKALLDTKRKIIDPAILEGKTVICDRYWPSLLAYQVIERPDFLSTSSYLKGELDQKLFSTKIDLLIFFNYSSKFSDKISDEFEQSRKSEMATIFEKYKSLFNSLEGYRNILELFNKKSENEVDYFSKIIRIPKLSIHECQNVIRSGICSLIS